MDALTIIKVGTSYKKIVAQFKHDPRYQFYHFAVEQDKSLPVIFIPIGVSLQDRQAMSNALRENEIDVAFLWSVWPETFCFTLHEAMAAGCFIITHVNSGNVQQLVQKSNQGVVMANEDEAVEWFTSGRIIESTQEFQRKFARFGSLVPTPGSYKLIFRSC